MTSPNGVNNVVTVTEDSILGSTDMDDSLQLFGMYSTPCNHQFCAL